MLSHPTTWDNPSPKARGAGPTRGPWHKGGCRQDLTIAAERSTALRGDKMRKTQGQPGQTAPCRPLASDPLACAAEEIHKSLLGRFSARPGPSNSPVLRLQQKLCYIKRRDLGNCVASLHMEDDGKDFTLLFSFFEMIPRVGIYVVVERCLLQYTSNLAFRERD